MADALKEAEFWLPPQFLSDHENLGFPSEFPYELSLNSPVESVISSNDTESSDEEDFLASLTQRLLHSTLRSFTNTKSETKAAMAGSPQSTLSGFGSSTVSSPNGPSQAPSPPTTPFSTDHNTWDLIYAAAGQVARLKMSSDGLIQPPQSSNLGLYSHASPFQYGTEDSLFKPDWSSALGKQVKFPKSVHQIQRQRRDFHHENGRFGAQSAWPSLPSTPAMASIPAPKKECVGTGVFLPRRYDNLPQPRKKTGKFVHGCNLNLEDLNRSASGTSIRRPAPSYDALTARRNAIFAQQRLNHHRPTEAVKSHELLLPQEWTY